VGVIGKRGVTVVAGWQSAFCAEIKAHGIWSNFWWAN
jgi:hypothetical protein